MLKLDIDVRICCRGKLPPSFGALTHDYQSHRVYDHAMSSATCASKTLRHLEEPVSRSEGTVVSRLQNTLKRLALRVFNNASFSGRLNSFPSDETALPGRRVPWLLSVQNHLGNFAACRQVFVGNVFYNGERKRRRKCRRERISYSDQCDRKLSRCTLLRGPFSHHNSPAIPLTWWHVTKGSKGLQRTSVTQTVLRIRSLLFRGCQIHSSRLFQHETTRQNDRKFIFQPNIKYLNAKLRHLCSRHLGFWVRRF